MDYPILWLSSTTTIPISPLLGEVNADPNATEFTLKLQKKGDEF